MLMLTKNTFFMVLILKMITITIRIVCFTTFNFFCLGTFSQENLCNPLFCPSAILFLFYRWRRFSFWKLQNNQVTKNRLQGGENCLVWMTWHNVMMWQWQDAGLICDIFQTFYIILMPSSTVWCHSSTLSSISMFASSMISRATLCSLCLSSLPRAMLSSCSRDGSPSLWPPSTTTSSNRLGQIGSRSPSTTTSSLATWPSRCTCQFSVLEGGRKNQRLLHCINRTTSISYWKQNNLENVLISIHWRRSWNSNSWDEGIEVAFVGIQR